MDKGLLVNSHLIITLLFIGLIFSLMFLWLERRNRQFSNHIIASFLDAASIPSFRNSLEYIHKELSRARRSHSPLSVITIGYHPVESGLHRNRQETSSGLQNVLGHHKKTDMTDFLLCGTVIRDALRDIDIVSFAAANSQYILVLPESTKAKAENALARIKNIVDKETADQFVTGVAEFPNDGLILEDLVAYATDSMKNRRPVAQLV